MVGVLGRERVYRANRDLRENHFGLVDVHDRCCHIVLKVLHDRPDEHVGTEPDRHAKSNNPHDFQDLAPREEYMRDAMASCGPRPVTKYHSSIFPYSHFLLRYDGVVQTG